MPRKRKRSIDDRTDKDQIIGIRNRIAQKTMRSIVILSSFLIILCLGLAFRIGEPLYPSWIAAHRTQTIGVLLLALTAVILSSPLVVEVNSNPRPLSGPGKNPKSPNLP
jgi:hypothetical protein